jgi:heparanase 1
MMNNQIIFWTLMSLLGLMAAACQSGTNETSNATAGKSPASSNTLAPANMARVGTIDERYQAYNIEMLEVTGGKFWKPYGPELEKLLKQPPPTPTNSSGDTPAGMNPAIYEYRPPIDLTNARLRKLAAALGPSYVRVSGTWANTTYFPDTDQAPKTPPVGFGGVLSRQQWKGVIDYSKAVDAGIVTSFATGVGTRDKAGIWTPEQAKRFLDYTVSAGGKIAAAEFMNEPTVAAMGGAPSGYGAADYGRDFKVFHAFAKQAAPDMLIIGPGSVGETTGDWSLMYGVSGTLKTRDMLEASRPANVDGFSYHHYGASSQRCSASGMPGTTAEDALTEAWLKRTDQTLEFYRPLRDEFEPGKPFWLTETADAACGGNPWGGTFLDTFRYLDQLGRLAKQDVKVHIHNTLVASDYGLLDDQTFEPKPNYWAALLWRKLMGMTVLESGIPIQAGQHVYAHCLRGTPGGVALLVINTDKAASRTLSIPVAGERYTMTSSDLQSKTVQLNGTELKLGTGDELPVLAGIPTQPGNVEFAPAPITFIALPQAGNGACR